MKKSLVALALFTTLASSTVMAKDVKRISKTMDVEQGQKISLNVPVGSLDVQTCDCNEITIKVTVEPSNNKWGFFSSGADVDNAELKIRERSSGLSFEIDEDDTKQKWKVTLPASSALDIDMGVGSVDVEDLSNSLNAEVGVGQISVDLSGDNYQRIELESGVGDTSIDGFSGVKTKRSVVSSEASFRGDGEYSISIEVGVGSADVDLN
ncbi:MAG: hypothetical protein HRT35_08445 [Algicola sp.]|nr:hypothetical protein [Algicola sp.]